MTNSDKIAGLVGPAAVTLTMSEAMNLHIWAVNIAPVTYLSGTLLFIGGLAIIRSHNCWRGWPIIVTLTGWLCILGGLYRMFVPAAQQAPQTIPTYTALGMLFTAGIFLTFKAYGRKKNKQRLIQDQVWSTFLSITAFYFPDPVIDHSFEGT